jgi:hypothetical protein
VLLLRITKEVTASCGGVWGGTSLPRRGEAEPTPSGGGDTCLVCTKSNSKANYYSFLLYIIEKKFTMQKMGFFGKKWYFLKNFSAGAPELTFWYFS